MEKLVMEGSENDPRIEFDPASGRFEISGRSLSPNASVIFEPVFNWIALYAAQPNRTTEVVIKLEYINTGSSKMLLDLFFELQKISGASVSWMFPEDDEDMEETGEEFSELVKLPFELKPY